jgi:hypothetical protein
VFFFYLLLISRINGLSNESIIGISMGATSHCQAGWDKSVVLTFMYGEITHLILAAQKKKLI